MLREGVVLVFALSLAGCRADIVEPLPDRARPDEIEVITGGREAWTPAVRLIRADGNPSTEHLVQFDNEFYYDAWPTDNELSEFLIAQPRLYVQNGVPVGIPAPLHPPFSLHTTVDGIPVQLFDVDPAPGDTVEVDVRNPTRWIDLRVPEFVDGWPSSSVTISWRHRPQIQMNLGSRPAVSSPMPASLNRGLNPIVVSDTATELIRIELSWLDPTMDVEWQDYLFVDTAPGDTLLVDPRLREVQVRVLQDGAPLNSVPLLFRGYDADGNPPSAAGAETHRLMGAEAVIVPVFGDLVDLQVHADSDRFFVPRRLVFDATVVDSVTMDLGADDLTVIVEDAQGRGLRGRTVRVRSRTESVGSAYLTTGFDGRCDFVVDPDIYEIFVFGGAAVVDTTVALDGDASIRLIEREGGS